MNYNNLKTNPSNPRNIKKEQFERLKKSIGSFTKMLEIRPIAYDEDGVIWGGNMRYEALKSLDIEMKPEYFIELKGFSLEEKREFAIRDNIELGIWDDDILANEWSDLPLEEWGIDTTGWDEEVIEDDIPDLDDNVVSKLGEIYELGKHRLMCGDSTKIEDVEKLMNGQKADMVFTDPPYGIGLTSDTSNLQREKDGWKNKPKDYGTILGDDEQFNYKNFSWLECKEQFWFGGDYYCKTLSDGGSWFVWDKRTETTDSMLGSMFELCWSKQKHKREIVRVRWIGLHGTETQDVRNRIHPTQKPIELCSWFIEKFSDKDNIIIDLFGGSGSTLIACEQLDRTCYMMELDEKYCDVIRKRYAKFIGKEDEWQTI